MTPGSWLFDWVWKCSTYKFRDWIYSVLRELLILKWCFSRLSSLHSRAVKSVITFRLWSGRSWVRIPARPLVQTKYAPYCLFIFMAEDYGRHWFPDNIVLSNKSCQWINTLKHKSCHSLWWCHCLINLLMSNWLIVYIIILKFLHNCLFFSQCNKLLKFDLVHI